MTANWFEAKVKYVKVGEDGKEKKMLLCQTVTS